MSDTGTKVHLSCLLNEVDNVSNVELAVTQTKVKTSLCHVNPRSDKGRCIQMCQMLTIPLIPSAFLALLAAVSLLQAIQVRSQLSQTEENNEKGHDIAGLIHQLQQERNEVSFATIKNNSVAALTGIFLLTDYAINSLEWPGDTPGGVGVGGGSPMNELLSRETFVRTLTSGRYSNDFQLELKVYSELNAAAIFWLIQTVQNNNDNSFWENMIAYVSLIRAKENIGIYAPLGSEYFVLGQLSERGFVTYIQNLELSKDHLDISLQYSSFLAERYNQTVERNVETFSRFQQLQEVAVLNDDSFIWNQTVDYSLLWVTTVEDILDHLKELEDMLEDHILELVAEGLAVASLQINIYVLAIACVAVIVPLISCISWRVTTNMQRFARGLEDKTQLLHQEKKRSDSLLYRMLPRSVAIQLKGDHEVRAENYEAVTIYFSDIVGFTVLSSNSSPMQVVSLLNGLYNLFDSRIEVYDVYKVETIGDSYMVASGLPNRNGDKHAGEIATLALDLMDRLRYFQVPHRPEEKLQLRVGLHTGACAAGVVGSKMPRYCLFGDTVNTASRMESHSQPMKIHISEDCKKFLEKTGNYRIAPRGSVDIKGKGVMKTFWLEENLDHIKTPSNGRSSSSPVWKNLLPSKKRSTEYAP